MKKIEEKKLKFLFKLRGLIPSQISNVIQKLLDSEKRSRWHITIALSSKALHKTPVRRDLNELEPFSELNGQLFLAASEIRHRAHHIDVRILHVFYSRRRGRARVARRITIDIEAII